MLPHFPDLNHYFVPNPVFDVLLFMQAHSKPGGGAGPLTAVANFWATVTEEAQDLPGPVLGALLHPDQASGLQYACHAFGLPLDCVPARPLDAMCLPSRCLQPVPCIQRLSGRPGLVNLLFPLLVYDDNVAHSLISLRDDKVRPARRLLSCLPADAVLIVLQRALASCYAAHRFCVWDWSCVHSYRCIHQC